MNKHLYNMKDTTTNIPNKVQEIETKNQCDKIKIKGLKSPIRAQKFYAFLLLVLLDFIQRQCRNQLSKYFVIFSSDGHWIKYGLEVTNLGATETYFFGRTGMTTEVVETTGLDAGRSTSFGKTHQWVILLTEVPSLENKQQRKLAGVKHKLKK